MTKFGVPTNEQLAKINRISKRPLTAEEVFAFSGKSAGDMMIPGRYTRLSPQLLQVMVDDAKKSVSFMLNHNWSSFGVQGIPYGKVFDGRIESSILEGETIGLHLDKYIVRDSEVNDGISADSMIKKIETGILSDTSIGFSTDNMVCSICGMNYFGGECNHWRGRTYDLADGTKKLCTLTAMPPSIIIPYNNNALFEESIVWDGAYPGAMVTQSKHGDIVELPTGNFSVVDDKEELPKDTLFYGKYHNGDIVTMVKKSDHKKLFKGAKVDNENLEGSENLMDEKALEMLMKIGFTKEEAESLGVGEVTTALNAIVEKWDITLKAIEENAEPLKFYMTEEQAKESLGTELSADGVLKLAKEGQEYRKQLVDETIAMGVRAMGNDFKAETWKATLATMETMAIKDIKANFETQANVGIPAGRLTNPDGQMQSQNVPDEAFL